MNTCECMLLPTNLRPSTHKQDFTLEGTTTTSNSSIGIRDDGGTFESS